MEKLLQMVMYFSWALWLIYSYLVLFSKKQKPDRKLQQVTLFHAFLGMALVTIVMVFLFVLLSKDFKSESNYFITAYNFNIDPQKKIVSVGNSREYSDITIENNSSDDVHLRLKLNEKDFSLQNISERKKVDLNGRYLNKLVLRQGDEVEINGKEKIKVLKINAQYPLGRSFQVSIRRPGQKEGEKLTFHTLLNKRLILQYRKTGSQLISFGLNQVRIPGALDKPVVSIVYEPNRSFLGMNIYYFIVILTIVLLSIGIYFYFRNRFNGALLLLFMVSLPFMAGFVSFFVEFLIIIGFLPFIFFVQRKRRSQTGSDKTTWNWGTVLLVVLFAAIFILPFILRMDGDFTLQYYDFSQKEALQVTRGKETFQLKDIKKNLAYGEGHRVILGHTTYRLVVTRQAISLIPLDPETIKISPDFKAIICDLSQVSPGDSFIYLKYPHQFASVPAAAAAGKKQLKVSDDKGNHIVLSKITNRNYAFYLRGLVFYLIIPFWLFLLLTYFGPALNQKFLQGVQGDSFFKKRPPGRRRQKILNRNNIMIYQFVYFMLGLGYVVFGALALYNNSYIKNFAKFRDQALPLFVGIFLLSLLFSCYNRWLVFFFRVIKQKKFHVPLIVGLLLILLVNYSQIFLYLGIVFLIFVFFFRLRKDLYYEYINSHSFPLNIKSIIEKTVSSFEDRANQGILFGLGRILNNQGWNYLLVSDVLLLLALFFIVLQLFLGGELGVPVAGFLFLPIELGKILLTIYFADWVSRIDRGMKLNVLWVYGLVLIPFVLLVVFLKDFSPLMVFFFVFLYHIIKIKKNWKFKLLLTGLIVLTVVISVTALSRYTFPFRYFGIIFSILIMVFLLRVWFKRGAKILPKVLVSLVLVLLLVVISYTAFFRMPSAPKALASRIDSWLNPWQDYNLSYQYVNSLWLMKGAGTFGKSSEALSAAGQVPLIEKDLSFSLYVSVLGTIGTAFIFFTLFMVMAYVHQLVRIYGAEGRGSPVRWYLYLLEFLVVIFLAQFLVPALYAVGLLPIMGQPLPFLSYSNNMLLLFALPFSFLMIVIGNNVFLATEDTEGTEST